MDLVFSFKDINPNNEPEWTCPHCSRAFATSRTHYYNSHHGGRCLLSAGQQATAHKGIEQLLTEDGAYIDELGNEYTGEAALLAMQHDAARADLEQRCIELGVTQEQLAGLQGVLQQMAQPITHLLSNLDSTQQAAEEALDADAAAEQQQAEALRDRLDQAFCPGAPFTAYQALVLLFEWRCEHSVKVRRVLMLTACPQLCTDAASGSSAAQSGSFWVRCWSSTRPLAVCVRDALAQFVCNCPALAGPRLRRPAAAATAHPALRCCRAWVLAAVAAGVGHPAAS